MSRKYKSIEDILTEKIAGDSIFDIECFLGHPISIYDLENIEDRIREVLDQMPEEELLIYKEKYHIGGDHMKKLEQKYLDVLEKLEWNVTDYTDDGRVELEKYSPAGEDFLVCVEVEDFPARVDKYAFDFDVDEHIEMLIEAKKNGLRGVPSTRELVKDAEDIQKMLDELADALNEADYPRQEKVRITVEKVLRVSKIVKVTKSELEDLKNGESQFFDEMADEIMSGTEEWNYCVNYLDGSKIFQYCNS